MAVSHATTMDMVVVKLPRRHAATAHAAAGVGHTHADLHVMLRLAIHGGCLRPHLHVLLVLHVLHVLLLRVLVLVLMLMLVRWVRSHGDVVPAWWHRRRHRLLQLLALGSRYGSCPLFLDLH